MQTIMQSARTEYCSGEHATSNPAHVAYMYMIYGTIHNSIWTYMHIYILRSGNRWTLISLPLHVKTGNPGGQLQMPWQFDIYP